MRPESGHEPEPQQAGDVVAFGQEFGRVLSDGRIVGRAEPFAKVFPSSRAVKRAVGVTAWAILEDIALDAQLDVEGRLVAETNVRRIAVNLGLAKNTVAKHLGRLREHGFVLHEEGRDREAGRFETARYVLDPTAALERFTVTPSREGSSSPRRSSPAGPEGPCRNVCDTAGETCPAGCDTGPCPGSCDTEQNGRFEPSSPVSQSSGHRGLGQDSETVAADQQLLSSALSSETDADPSSGGGELFGRLISLGVDESTADALVTGHPLSLVRDAVDAVAGVGAHKPAGWVVAAIRGRWDVSEAAAKERRLASQRQRQDLDAASRDRARDHEQLRLERTDAWLVATVAALDDDQLVRVVSALTEPVALIGRRALPEVRSRLARWSAAIHLAHTDAPLSQVLTTALERVDDFDANDAPEELPAPPARTDATEVDDADRRLRHVLRRLDGQHQERPEFEEANR